MSQATAIVICFPKQSKSARCKSRKSEVAKPKAAVFTVLEWVRNGYQFPGKLLPPAKPPKPTPGPISVPPSPDNPPRKPGEKRKGAGAGVSADARPSSREDDCCEVRTSLVSGNRAFTVAGPSEGGAQ